MSTTTISNLPAAGALTGTEVLPIVQSNVTSKTTVQDIANLAGISGTNFLYVSANGTATANATALSSAYTTAQGMSPSATNRITIVAAPGYYDFGSTTFTMSTQYIDLVSLDGNRSIIFNSDTTAGTISITANNVFVKGVDVTGGSGGTGGAGKQFIVASGLGQVKVENCKGGWGSFGFRGTISGTYINCDGGLFSFSGGGASFPPAGIIDNGSSAVASGAFTNCIAGDNSFGQDYLGQSGTASGKFTNCTAGIQSFASEGIASGIFTGCVAGFLSFGGAGTASGTFTECTGGEGCFGYAGNINGVFTRCVGGSNSWISVKQVSGKLYFSRQSSGQTVPTPGLGGNIVAFITTQNNFIAQNP